MLGVLFFFHKMGVVSMQPDACWNHITRGLYLLCQWLRVLLLCNCTHGFGYNGCFLPVPRGPLWWSITVLCPSAECSSFKKATKAVVHVGQSQWWKSSSKVSLSLLLVCEEFPVSAITSH